MRIVKKYLPILLAILFCHCTDPAKEHTQIRVSVLRGPSAIAFAEWMLHPPVIGGKTVEVEMVDSPEIMQSLLIKGETDIAVLPIVSAANLYNKGIPYRVTGCPIWGTLYLIERKGRTAGPETPIHIFGAGTTPDILTRHYLNLHSSGEQPLNYAFSTPREIVQALLAGKVEAAVLSEPFLSIALAKDTTFRISANLNRIAPGSSASFAQTAIVRHPALAPEQQGIDSLLQQTCCFANEHPDQVIQILEEKGIFAPRSLTSESIRRCKIDYQTAREAAESIFSFLQLIYEYEPKAVGGKLPDRGFLSGTDIP